MVGQFRTVPSGYYFLTKLAFNQLLMKSKITVLLILLLLFCGINNGFTQHEHHAHQYDFQPDQIKESKAPIYKQVKLEIGDPGVTFDQNVIDANQSCYPQMQRWSEAGVTGGIPFLNTFDQTTTISSGNSSTINNAINAMSNSLSANQKGLIILSNGTYTINSKVRMKSNVSLKGQSRDGVVCTITMTSGHAFEFNSISYAGIYDLTIQGSWGTPYYNWNYSLNENDELPNNSNISVKFNSGSNNCWLDRVTILNCARDPLRCNGSHNTLRDLYVKGAHKKSGGAQGYFFIQNRDNLVTGCYVTHLRHISLQGGNVEYNVVYDNDFDQEVSFHTGDNGNNLIENNRITLPYDMPPVAPGDADAVTPVEARTNAPTYFAIMGPWSSQHQNSANPNYIINNQCLQQNHNFGSNTPWSQPGSVYTGPLQLGLSIQERINNFPLVSGSCQNPSGSTLYPVQLGMCPDANGAPIGTACDDSDPCTTGDVYDSDCNCAGTYTDADGDGYCVGNDPDDNDACNPDICPICPTSINNFPYTEGFESGLGQWSQSGGDDLDWTRDSGGTPSNNTGPSSAYEGTWYMYIEASQPNYPSKTAGLISPCFDLMDMQTASLNFQYHMYGTATDMDLDVQISTDGGATWSSAIWSQTGNQGNQWNSASVNLDTYVGQYVMLRFWGATGEIWQGDITIDDIEVDAAPTCTPDTACDDGDLCTAGETYDTNCNCTGGTLVDSDSDGVCDDNDQCPGTDDSMIGTACDDGDVCTTGDVYDSSCNCAGTVQDADGDGVCDANDICSAGDDNVDTDGDGTPDACDPCDGTLAGTTCDDGDACTTGEIYDANCNCTGGTFQDADNDGVCDVNDVCPDADDSIDTDSDGTPDDCDECPNDPNNACGTPPTYCTASATNTNYEYIQQIVFGSINNTSGDNGGYGDFTSQTTNVGLESSVPFSLTPGFVSSSYSEAWKVWIDFNRDGDFDDVGEEVYNGVSTSTLSGNIAIPNSASLGPTGMRVSMQWNNAPSSPCGTFQYGEVEDYTVNITVLPAQLIGSFNDNNFTEGSSLHLYPNPASNDLYVNLHEVLDMSVTEKISVIIYSLDGKQVYQNQTDLTDVLSVDIQDLPNNQPYLLRLQTNEGDVFTGKFVKL